MAKALPSPAAPSPTPELVDGQFVDRPRFEFIQALRGIAALLVVWSHLSGFWLQETGNMSALQYVWEHWVVEPFHIFQNGGHLGVVIFFLISGYIITHTSLRETRRDFAIKRVLRIFPALAVATLVCWLLLFVARATHTTLFGINDGGVLHWLSGLVLVDGFLPGGRVLDVTWTLIVEVGFYALTLVLLGISRRRPLVSVWIMIAVWSALSMVSLNNDFLRNGANSGVFIYLGFLILGRIIYLWHRKLIALPDALVTGVLTAVLYLVFIETFQPDFLLAPGGWKGYEPVVSYVFAVLIFFAFLRWSPKKLIWPFGMLGDISYSLYLLHLPIGITVLNLLDLAHVPATIGVIVAILVSIGVSWVSWRWIERPTQALARRWTRRIPRSRSDSIPAEPPRTP